MSRHNPRRPLGEREFVNALRECLDLEPLYEIAVDGRTQEDRDARRFYVAPSGWNLPASPAGATTNTARGLGQRVSRIF